jgi:hypothetical protein
MSSGCDRRFTAGLVVCAGAFALLAMSSEAFAVTRYVNANLASGANDGTSWDNAHQGAGGLAIALTASVNGDQIWVAQGSYKPTLTATRSIFFNLKSGVQIYGGFVGNEATLAERDHLANVTILTGDLLGNDGPPGSFTNNADNSHHIVNGASANSTAVLDGFIITAGNANGAGASNFDKGGGIIFLASSNATIRNCNIQYNRCTFGGGAVYMNLSSPSFTDVIMQNNIGGSFGGAIDMNNCNPSFNRVQFIGNSAARAGGVEIFGNSNPTIYNCLFRNNAATGANGGGGLWLSGSTAAIRNCTIANNTSVSTGAGIQNGTSTTTIYNTIIWNNTGPGGATAGQQINGGTNTVQYSIVQGGFAGTANLNVNPQFVSVTDLHLQPTSPAIDSGNNSLVPAAITMDLDLNQRKVDDPNTTDTGLGTPPLVDRGAHEYQPPPVVVCIEDIAPKGGNDVVDVDDLLLVINSWGACAGCPADITGNDVVDVDDLLAVINAWGACE